MTKKGYYCDYAISTKYCANNMSWYTIVDANGTVMCIVPIGTNQEVAEFKVRCLLECLNY